MPWDNGIREYGPLPIGLEQTLVNDDKKELLSKILQDKSLFQLRGQEIFVKACKYHAVECAIQLIKGEMPLVLGINGRAPDKMFMIHHAALTCNPSITEALLHYGAQANVRADVRCICRLPRFKPKLPLYLTLYMMSCDESMTGVSYSYHILKLIASVCLPRFQNHLETVGLLAWNTQDEELENEFLEYVRDGELVHIAGLLAVAHKKLSSPIKTLLEPSYVLNSNFRLPDDWKDGLMFLLKVFVRAGDAIEAYVKQGKIGVTLQQTCNEVAALLQEAGFDLEHTDIDLTRGRWSKFNRDNKREWRWKPEDSSMQHFGKSGHRWMVYGKPSKPVQILGKGNKKFVEKISCHAGCPSSRSFSQALARPRSEVFEVECPGALRNIIPKMPQPLLSFARIGFSKKSMFFK